MNWIKSFFAKRAPGFYVACGAALLLVATLISYGVFGGAYENYFSAAVIAVAVVGIVAFVAMSVFSKTEKYAPVALWVFIFVSLLLFINAAYMYFSEVFYSGVSAETFGLIDPSFLASVILFVLAVVAANVACWMKQAKPSVQDEQTKEGEEA